MNKVSILVTANHQDRVDALLREIDQTPGWQATGAVSVETAIEKFHQQPATLAVLAKDITVDEQKKLTIIFTLQHPDVILLSEGAEVVTISSDIQLALDEKTRSAKPSFSFVDDALKNAGLNIQVS